MKQETHHRYHVSARISQSQEISMNYRHISQTIHYQQINQSTIRVQSNRHKKTLPFNQEALYRILKRHSSCLT